jgi:hypothetical protein
VIQATHRLGEKIFSGDCKGLKDFYDKMEEPTRITRSTDKGDLTTTTVKNIPNPGFRAQSIILYNKLTDDRKISRISFKKFPYHSTFIYSSNTHHA